MDFSLALAQINPTLGNVAANMQSHLEFIKQAKQQNVKLVVFPELSLTGYMLQDLTQDLALTINSAPIKKLVALSKDIAILFGFVEESADHRFYNSALFAENGKILHVHRKVHLPTYGIFDEGRYFASGETFRAFNSKLGRFGVVVCEDLWHFTSSYLHFLQGVDAIFCISASPGRGIAVQEAEVQTARAWDTFLTAQSIYFNVYSVFCNRVGFEDGVLFWGGSKVISPFGRVIARAKGLDEMLIKSKVKKAKSELALAKVSASALKRSRIFAPMLRDEKPDLVVREIQRILHERSAHQ